MKWTLAIFVLIGCSSEASLTCLSYFKAPYSREGAIAYKPERLGQIRDVLANLNGVSREEAYQAALEKYMSEASSEIRTFKVHISNIKKSMKGERSNIERLQERVYRTEDRIADLEKRHQLFVSKLGFLKRLFLLKAKTARHAVTLKKITKQLEGARKKRQLQALEHATQLSEYEYVNRIQFEKAIRFNENEIDALILQAKAKAEQFADKYSEGVSTAKSRLEKEAETIVSDFAREWVLSQYDLVTRAESYKEDLNQKVCAAGTCMTLGQQLVADISKAQTALTKVIGAQRHGVIRELRLRPETRLRTYVKDAFTNLAFAERVLERGTLDPLEETTLEIAVQIVKERKPMFNTLSSFEKALDYMSANISLAFRQTGDREIRSSIDARELQNRYATFQVILSELLIKVNQYKGQSYINLKQYEQLSQLLIQASYQINFIVKTLEIVRQDLSHFLDREGLIKHELDQVEQILWQDFLNTQPAAD